MKTNKWVAKRTGIGKKIGNDYYVHVSAISYLPSPMQKVIMQAAEQIPAEFGGFEVLKYQLGTNTVAFIKSSDWLTASEPTVGDRVVIAPGKLPVIKESKHNLVYHHRWMFVAENYPEFSVQDEMRWSEHWKNSGIPEAQDTSRIGRKEFWEKHVLPKLPGVGVRYTKEEIKVANGTYRGKGSVGPNAIVPRYIKDNLIGTNAAILDYGAGRDAIHVRMLHEAGFDVTGHDFGRNLNADLHETDALARKYDLVYLSNVLNVQNNEDMVRRTLRQVKGVLTPTGRVFFNYPSSPRKAGLTNGKMTDIINQVLGEPKSVNIKKGTPFWEVQAA